MCGIFGITSKNTVNLSELKKLASLAQQRGRDSSGLIVGKKSKYVPYKADNSIMNLITKVDSSDANLLLGHSRLITNGHADNQPVIRDKIMVLHNGIITNFEELWEEIPEKSIQWSDRESDLIIESIFSDGIESGKIIGPIFRSKSLIISNLKKAKVSTKEREIKIANNVFLSILIFLFSSKIKGKTI